ncbi:hypothetical protein [Moraxella lacunata]|uniref:hypothetical protein n=1 Tax=Moraxella lacunata TaxID=477 RepID=UPI003EE13328
MPFPIYLACLIERLGQYFTLPQQITPVYLAIYSYHKIAPKHRFYFTFTPKSV